MNAHLSKENNKSKALSAIVDDGTRKIPILNKFGKLICNIYIRPTDFSILDRYDDFVKDFNEIVSPLAGINIENDGTAKAEEFSEEWKTIKAVETEIKDRFNKLFDMEEADEIFATRNAFSSVGGNFFCANVLLAIGDVIKQAIEEEAARSQEKMAKYLTPDNAEGVEDAGVFTEGNKGQ